MATPEHIAELEKYYATRMAPNMAKAVAVAQQDRPLASLQGNAAPILARLMAGENCRQIAQSLSISRRSLNAWLLTHAAEEWRAIASGIALERQQDAEELLADADDQLSVAKGREQGRLASWTLERLAPKLYGQPGKDGTGGIVVNVNVDRSCAGTITVEHSPE